MAKAETYKVVYVIQKSNKYGLKQVLGFDINVQRRCVCHSKK